MQGKAQNIKIEPHGILKGHGGMVTSLQVGTQAYTDENGDEKSRTIVVSGSRDKKLILWEYTGCQDESQGDFNQQVGYAIRSFSGHNHFIEDVALSFDGRYAVTSSWDKTLRLWDFNTKASIATFIGHDKDVLSVAFSPDNRQIVSGARDKSIKLWNVKGDCKYSIDGITGNHSGIQHLDWVSQVRFSPEKEGVLATASWDKQIKIWDRNTMQLKFTFTGHKSQINTIAFAPKRYLASGDHSGVVNLWSVVDGTHSRLIDFADPVNSVAFTPQRPWMTVATEKEIKIYNLKHKDVIDTLRPEEINASGVDNEEQKKKSSKEPKFPEPLCIQWNQESNLLFAGYNDGLIRVFKVDYVTE